MSGPKPDFHTAGPGRALSRQAQAWPLVNGPRPGSHTAGSGRVCILRAPTGLSYANAGRALYDETSAGGTRPSFHLVYSGRALSRLTPAGVSYSEPRPPGPPSEDPTRLSYGRPSGGSALAEFSIGGLRPSALSKVRPCRAFIRQSQAGISYPGPRLDSRATSRTGLLVL